MRVWVLEPLGPEDVGRAARPRARRPARAWPAGCAWARRRGRRSSRGPAATRAARSTCWRPPPRARPTARRSPLEAVQSAAGGRAVVYDREGDAHYDTISAFIKSLRAQRPGRRHLLPGGDAQRRRGPEVHRPAADRRRQRGRGERRPAGARGGGGGRRARSSSSGLPEARINLAQATTYIALAPKSNASYRAIGAALDLRGARGRAPAAAGAARRQPRQRPQPRPRRRATVPARPPRRACSTSRLLPEGLEGRDLLPPHRPRTGGRSWRRACATCAARLRRGRPALLRRRAWTLFSAQHLVVLPPRRPPCVGLGPGGAARPGRRAWIAPAAAAWPCCSC